MKPWNGVRLRNCLDLLLFGSYLRRIQTIHSTCAVHRKWNGDGLDALTSQNRYSSQESNAFRCFQFCLTSYLMPVRLTLGDLGAPGWREPWFPLRVLLVPSHVFQHGDVFFLC